MLAVIKGIGETEFSKDSGRSDLRLNLEASLTAIRDAGLTPGDIDGIVVPGLVGATAEDLMTNFGIDDLAYTACVHMGGAGPLASLAHARLAVLGGVAKNVLISFGYNGRSANRVGRRPPVLQLGGAPLYRRNYDGVSGLIAPSALYALWAQRYMHECGWKNTEPMGHVARIQSRYAVMNGLGMMDREITLEEHQESRLISEPFRLYDVCRETDGACAIVVSATESPGSSGSGSGDVVIRGIAEGHPAQPDMLTVRRPFLDSAIAKAGQRAFAMAGCTPADIDFTEIYDAFTFHVIWQLEALGFCPPGEGGAFVTDGNTELSGRLPTNTHGGLLSQAHLWGINHITEAVKQLRGTAGAAQVAGARRGLVSGNGDLGDGAVGILEAV